MPWRSFLAEHHEDHKEHDTCLPSRRSYSGRERAIYVPSKENAQYDLLFKVGVLGEQNLVLVRNGNSPGVELDLGRSRSSQMEAEDHRGHRGG